MNALWILLTVEQGLLERENRKTERGKKEENSRDRRETTAKTKFSKGRVCIDLWIL